jgi:aryl-alcohol dehydrogenase-like predicted oxidoreductase
MQAALEAGITYLDTADSCSAGESERIIGRSFQSLPADSRAAQDPQGIYARRINRLGLRVASRLPSLAADRGLTPGQLALLWIKDQPGITAPIIGPRTIGHLKEMLPVADRHADDRLRAAFDQLDPPGRAVSDFHNTSGWSLGGSFHPLSDEMEFGLPAV